MLENVVLELGITSNTALPVTARKTATLLNSVLVLEFIVIAANPTMFLVLVTFVNAVAALADMLTTELPTTTLAAVLLVRLSETTLTDARPYMLHISDMLLYSVLLEGSSTILDAPVIVLETATLANCVAELALMLSRLSPVTDLVFDTLVKSVTLLPLTLTLELPVTR